MTIEIAFLFALLAGMVFLFLTEKIPVDLTAFLGLVILIFARYLTPSQAFTGFASPAVITMLSIFIVGAGLLHTGVADTVAEWVHRWVGSREVPLVVVLMAVAGLLSAFMNNIAATAVLMPAVASLARRAALAPSRLFMPLAFGAIIGGTTTLVGTPPNILVGEMLRQHGLEPFGLFDFTPVGLVLLACGILFMITVGRRLLPVREAPGAAPEGLDLARLYRLERDLFTLRIPEGSPLEGRSLRQARLGTALGVPVVAILRDGRRHLAPTPDTSLSGGDVLLVKGDPERLRELLRVQGVTVERIAAAEIPAPLRGVSGVRGRLLPGSPLIGRSLKELRFRDRFGVTVLAVRRGDRLLREALADEALQAEDRLLALGTREEVTLFASQPDFEVREVGISSLSQLQRDLFLIRLRESSPLAGRSLAESRIGELAGLTVAGIIRNGRTQLGTGRDEVLQAGDQLLVAGEPSRIVSLLELGEVRIDEEAPEPELESDDIGVVEAVIAPRSSLPGRTLAELEFRDRYGLQVLSVWRGGHPVTSPLPRLLLRFGDALLLQGPREKIRRLAADPDFVVLTEGAGTPRRTRKAPLAVAGLGLMVVLVVTGLQPIHVAAFTAATLLLLSGVMTMQEAYRAIEWRAIFLVAAVLPVGLAMESSGAALLLAERVAAVAGPLGPYAVLASLVVLSSLLSQGLDGAPAVVLLTPVVLEIAAEQSLSPYPLMMGVGLAASAAFMTPFSHKANLLVMGAGGYRSGDYLKVGSPLTVLLLVLMVVLVPVFFPF